MDLSLRPASKDIGTHPPYCLAAIAATRFPVARAPPARWSEIALFTRARPGP